MNGHPTDTAAGQPPPIPDSRDDRRVDPGWADRNAEAGFIVFVATPISSGLIFLLAYHVTMWALLVVPLAAWGAVRVGSLTSNSRRRDDAPDPTTNGRLR